MPVNPVESGGYASEIKKLRTDGLPTKCRPLKKNIGRISFVVNCTKAQIHSGPPVQQGVSVVKSRE